MDCKSENSLEDVLVEEMTFEGFWDGITVGDSGKNFEGLTDG